MKTGPVHVRSRFIEASCCWTKWLEIPVSVKPEPGGRSGSGGRCVPRSCGGDTTYHRPCSSGRCRGKAYHEKFRRCDREGKKSWRTKHAYFPWRPSGTPLPQNREEGHLLCRCPPFGTPDQTLTGGLPLRSTAYHFVNGSYHIFPCCFFANCVAWRQVNLHKFP